ncbi:MAG: VCBS repeat-containing protein, partial [Planctomycetota bacterium]|nr:VCBS repeat-containing protein [Planctomycetota bacterium]
MTRHASSPDNPDHDEPADDAVIGVALKWSLAVLGMGGLVAATIVYWASQPEPAEELVEQQLVVPTIRERPQVEIPELPFTDITEAAGLDFVHENGASGEKLLPETMGGGGGFVDVDADGDADIVLVNGCRWPWEKNSSSDAATPALYLNDGTGQFTNATAGSGLDVTFYGTGLAAGDIDGDGLTDLFISAVGPDRLFRNLGDGRFEEITETAGVGGSEGDWGSSCGFFDYDRDGDLDLFVCNYVVWNREIDAAQNFQLIGGGRAYGRPQNFAGSFPRLYRNDGQGIFMDVSAESGIQVRNPATDVPVAKSLGLTFDDFDADGWLDVVVSNDTVQNFLFRNQHDGTFEEVGRLAGIAFDIQGNARGAMGIDVACFRNDADRGIVIGNFANEMTALYVSRGAGLQFKDDAIANGLGPQTRLELTFGVLFADIDLDGRLDVVAANGHLEEEINRVQKTQFYEQPPRLYFNCGAEQATEFLPVGVDKTGEDFARPMVGRSLATADIDGDGDLDLLFTASGGPPRLLRNDQALGHHWLRIHLVDEGANYEAIGG